MPSLNKGTTISDWDAELQAICPGNSSTSFTIKVSALAHEVPQTPLPFLILVHATGPWNGPKTNSSPFTK